MGLDVTTGEITIRTDEGEMGTFTAHPTDGGPHPLVVFLMDAPGKRPLLHEMAARIASHGDSVMLPNLYARTLGGAPAPEDAPAA